ncbi:MAG TPA: hypothetical protein VKV80_07910 [Streptosporangiaceae bacterium]|nr:hypothetical protein [Streptosporangiaceae bacterium]
MRTTASRLGATRPFSSRLAWRAPLPIFSASSAWDRPAWVPRLAEPAGEERAGHAVASVVVT